MHIFLLALIALSSARSSFAAQNDECAMKGPCTCTKSDGSTLDLSPLGAENSFYSASRLDQSDNSLKFISYYFHPCKDIALPNVDNVTSNDCRSISICVRNVDVTIKNTTISNPGYQPKGTVEDVKFVTAPGGSIALHYKYTPTNVLVNLVCIPPGSNHLQIVNDDTKNTVLTFYSNHACLSPPTDHHSLGTTLLIILFVLVLVYLIGGCCVKHFLMGARGLEIIPNYSFWKELPSLVKDGIAFVQNGFKPPAQNVSSPGQNPNPNSYDSI